MKVRFFNIVEPVTSFFRDLVPYLAQQGVHSDVVISGTEYRTERTGLNEILEHPYVRIKQIPAGFSAMPRGPFKLWIMFSYTIGASLVSLFGHKTQVNFFLTQPPLYSVWGYVLKFIRGQRYGCLLMDVYPDVAIRDGLLKDNSVLARFLKGLSSFTLRHADFVIVIGRCMQEYILDMGVRSERVFLIPNWANEREILPVTPAANPLRKQLGLENVFIVLYSGNMGICHFFKDILEVARRLRDVPDIRFVFFGNGVRRKEIVEAKEKLGLDNVSLFPFQPPEALSASLSLADVHFISLKSGFEGLVVPSKAYGAMAAGRPIVYQGDSRGEIARMIMEENIGAVVKQDDPDSLEKVILNYYENVEMSTTQGERARRLATTKYSSVSALERYYQILNDSLSQVR